LIEDLLTISRLESGTDQFQLQPVDLHASAQRVIDDLQNRAEESKVTLKN
jgi:signal transduction histidine kinase